MRQSTLWKYFQKLTANDLRELRKFLQSPFHNKRSDVLDLFEYLVKIRKGTVSSLKKEAAYKAIYKKEAYDDRKMRYLLSFLLNAIKEYFSISEFKKSTFDKKLMLCEALRHKGLDTDFSKEWESLKKNKDQNSSINSEAHFQNYLLYREFYEHASQKKRRGEMKLQELSNELSYFFAAEILKQASTIQTYTTMSSDMVQLPLFEEVLQAVENQKFNHVPVVQLYYHSYRALLEPEKTENYLQLKKLVEEHWKKFPSGEIRDIFLLAINYCIKKWNSGEKEYMQEVFEWYRKGLQREVLLEDGFLSRFTYKNILTAGLLVNESEWVFNFLNDYKSAIKPALRENTYKYNLAVFYFRQSNYEKAMRLLITVQSSDVLYNLDVRRMLLRIYFELGEHDALDSLLDSFEVFTRRKKNIGYHRENYLNLIKIMKKIRKTNLRDRAKVKKIKEQVQSIKSLAEKKWLLEKLEALA